MKVKAKNAASHFFPNTSFQFVYLEAVANAIDAGASDIKIHVEIAAFADPSSLKITITDNGGGFDDENFERFSNLLDTADPQHKGIGRLIFLNYFSKVAIDSHYGASRRSFVFSHDFEGESSVEATPVEKRETVIKLERYHRERIYKYEYLSHQWLKDLILRHFMLKMYQIKLSSGDLSVSIKVDTDVPSPDHNFHGGLSKLDLSDLPDLKERLTADSFQLAGSVKMLYAIERDLERPKSFVSAICVDNRTLPIDLIPERNYPDGYQIVFLLCSDYFDGKSNNTREELDLDDATKQRVKALFVQIVSSLLREEIPEINEKNDLVSASLESQYPHLAGYFNEHSIGLLDKSSVVQSAQYKFFADQREILEADELSDDQYQLSLDFSSRILTEYILYRSKIIQKLKEMDKSCNEKEIHNLLVPKNQIFHQNSRINDIFLNNAWVLDDKYMSYSKVISDLDLEKIFAELGEHGSHHYAERESGRPDITVVFSRDPESSDVVDVVVVELKKLGLDLAKKEEVISQLQQRARRLLEFYPNKIQRVWFYGIIDLDKELIASLIEREYVPIFSQGSVYYKKQKIVINLESRLVHDADFFILSYDTMLADAEVRNSAFLELLRESLKVAAEGKNPSSLI